MSWINSNATNKQNSKNDLSFYHGFSKTPVEPTSTGTAATTLGNASTKGGHTVIGTEVWAEEIPWFGLVPSRAVAVTRLSGLTKLNDLVKVDGEGGKVYKYIGADDATFTEAQWSSFWQEVTLTNGMTLNNRHNQPVLRYYLNQPMQTLTTTNNASIDSKGYATRLFVDESNHTGQTSGGAVVSQFAAGTDNIKNGIPSVELNPKLYLGTTEKIAGTHYYDYNVSGTILWSTAVTNSSPKISCFRYIGKTVTGQFATIESTISSHSIDISDIKLALGLDTPDTPNTSVTARVETVEDVVRVLLGLGDDATITASESISTTANNAATSAITTALAEGGSISQKITSAINGLGDVAVKSDITITDIKVKQGSGEASSLTITDKSVTIEIPEVPAANVTEGGAVTEDGFTKTADVTNLAKAAISDATLGDGQKIATTADTSKLVTVEDVTTYVSENAKVTLTQGTGITVTPNGEASTSFTVAVDDSVATKKSVDDLSSLVSGLPATIQAAQDTADEALGLAETAIQKVTVNGTDSSGTEVSITALTAVDSNSTGSNGITIGETDKKVTLSVTPATYTKKNGQTPGSWGEVKTNFATAQSVSDAIADAVSSIVIPTLSTSSTGVGLSASGHTVNITTANYTPASGDTAASWTNKPYLVTGATVEAFVGAETTKTLDAAKAYSDSLHTTSLDYVVLGDSESLPTASADTLGKIYLVASQNAPTADGAAISGSYVEYMTRKVSDTQYTWEKIGTTAADLSGYVKSVKISGGTYTASATNNGVLDLGTVASGINTENVVTNPEDLTNIDSVQALLGDNGCLYLGIASATSDKMGVSKLFSGHYNDMASVVDKSNTAVSLETVSNMFTQQNTHYSNNFALKA